MPTTSTLYAAGATGTTSAGVNWTSTANATGAPNATVALWANVTSAAVGTLELTGYDGQTAIGAQPSSVGQVTATITHRVTNTARVSATAQLFSGATAIGGTVPLAPTTSVAGQTITFPVAPTWAQLADLRVRLVYTRTSVTTAGSAEVDATGLAIDYTLAVNLADSAGAADAVSFTGRLTSAWTATAQGTTQAGAPQNYTASPADAAPATDSVTGLLGAVATVSDAAGTVDAVAAVAARAVASADAAAATDAVSASRVQVSGWSATVNGTTGGGAPQNYTASPADAAGAVDGVTAGAVVVNYTANPADTAGTADAATGLVFLSPTLVSRVIGIPVGGVAPVAVRTANATTVRLKVGTDPAVTQDVVFGPPATPNAQGDTQLSCPGLAAGTTYYFRVAMTNGAGPEVLDTAAQVGTFKTAPAGPASFAFSFGSCTDATDSAAMGAIAGRADDLFIHLGDLYYNDGGSTALANVRTQVSSKIQAASHAAVFRSRACAYTPSDHEGMSNNTTAGSSPTVWANWNQVFREMWPTAPDAIPATTGVYFTFAWGRVRFIILDGRSFASNSSATDNASKTMLGATQKQWLKDTVTGCAEPVVIIANHCPWIGTGDTDNWSAYNTERTELGNFFAAQTSKRIGMISGDMHAVAADDGSHAAGGVFVFHGAPLDNTSSVKGGPYTAGPYPSGSTRVQQYGRLVVTDTGGTTIGLAFTGWDAGGTARVTLNVNAATGNAATATPADTAGVTDAAAVAQDQQLAATDTSGAADAVTVTVDRVAAAADGAGATDAAGGAVDRTTAAADIAGAGDTVTVALDRLAAVADIAGATDSAVGAVGHATAAADIADSVDTATVTQASSRAPADAAAASDAVTVSASGNIVTGPADTTGASDAVTVSLLANSSAADTLAALDVATVTLARALGGTASDAAGATDAVTTARGMVTSAADTAGATDSVTADRAGAGEATASDTAGATDAVTVSGIRFLTAAPADMTGGVDDVVAAAAAPRMLADAAVAVDAVDTVLGSGRFTAAADAAGAADAVSAFTTTGRDIAITWGQLGARSMTAGALTALDAGGLSARSLLGTLEE